MPLAVAGGPWQARAKSVEILQRGRAGKQNKNRKKTEEKTDG